jgi:hypothetical protein
MTKSVNNQMRVVQLSGMDAAQRICRETYDTAQKCMETNYYALKL